MGWAGVQQPSTVAAGWLSGSPLPSSYHHKPIVPGRESLSERYNSKDPEIAPSGTGLTPKKHRSCGQCYGSGVRTRAALPMVRSQFTGVCLKQNKHRSYLIIIGQSILKAETISSDLLLTTNAPDRFSTSVVPDRTRQLVPIHVASQSLSHPGFAEQPQQDCSLCVYCRVSPVLPLHVRVCKVSWSSYVVQRLVVYDISSSSDLGSRTP